jgi:hypothetical protein
MFVNRGVTSKIWASRPRNVEFQSVFAVNMRLLVKPKFNAFGFLVKIDISQKP